MIVKNLLLFFVAGLLVSCSHKQGSVGDERLKWNQATLLEAYEQIGRKNAKWDDKAREALSEFAQVRSGKALEPELRAELVGDYAREAVARGCDDPLVRYLFCRFASRDSSKPLAYWQNEFRRVANDMAGSGYPQIRKFYANNWAANVLWKNRDTNLWSEISQFRRAAMSDLAGVLEDKSLPIEEVAEACAALLDTVGRNPKEVTNAYNMIERPLFKNWPKAGAAYFVKGQFYYQFAWRARGGGYADKVTEKGWKAFQENLAVAEKAFNQAWALDPKDARIPTEMIEMAVSQQKERPEMERWFDRAMNLNTNNYDACSKKLRYLSPNWYGSPEEMTGFGRECVESPKWGGRVPLILVDAHWQSAQWLYPAQRRVYWRDANVWADIKSAYEKFFRLNPEVTGSYHAYYARYAAWAEQWETFNQQLPLIHDLDEEFFGGKAAFDKLVAAAKQRKK
jgi:hypothetical protein